MDIAKKKTEWYCKNDGGEKKVAPMSGDSVYPWAWVCFSHCFGVCLSHSVCLSSPPCVLCVCLSFWCTLVHLRLCLCLAMSSTLCLGFRTQCGQSASDFVWGLIAVCFLLIPDEKLIAACFIYHLQLCLWKRLNSSSLLQFLVKCPVNKCFQWLQYYNLYQRGMLL